MSVMDTDARTLTLQEVAERLGVHYMTVYRYVRHGMIPARKERGAWRVLASDLATFRRRAEVPARRGEAPWARRLEARMVAGDAAGAWGVVEAALASGVEPAGVYVELLVPALHSVGERWAAGGLGVDEEHLASRVAARMVGRLGPRFTRRGKPRGTVVVAMPPGERHELGVAMLADLLRAAGMAVVSLGADTPVAALLHALERVGRTDVLCVGVVLDAALPAAGRMVAAARGRMEPGAPILCGGRAVPDAGAARALGADGWAGDLVEAARRVEDLVCGAGSTAREPVASPQR